MILSLKGFFNNFSVFLFEGFFNTGYLFSVFLFEEFINIRFIARARERGPVTAAVRNSGSARTEIGRTELGNRQPDQKTAAARILLADSGNSIVKLIQQ